MKHKAFPALLLSFCILLPALAQTTPAPTPQKPSDDQDEVVKITTNLVQVDAVVTKDGKMVTNLTTNDFEIYEDGKQQPITSFAFISNVPNKSPAQPIARDKNKTDGPPEAPINPNDPHRTVAFVVDDLGMSAESMGQVRRQLSKFVAEELQPNDLVAIIRTGGELGALQQFTNDKRLLNRAVDRLRWNSCSRVGVNVFHSVGSPEPDGFRCGYSYAQTGRALRFILDGLGQLPGRKSMVLMSDDLPRETQEIGVADMDFLGDRSAPGVPNDPPLNSLNPFGNRVDFSMMLRRIAEKAIRSSVVIYSVDTQGLQYTGGTAADSIRGDSRSIAQSLSALSASRSRLLWDRREGGELIARQTGGYQIRNSNSYKLDEILEDQSGYYLIGYRPTDETFNRKFHHIKAKVKRSGMSLRTRFGFFGVSEEEAERKPPTVRDITNLALASPFAAQDVDVDIGAFFANDKTNGSVVRSFVYLDAKDMTFTPVNGRQQASLDLHGVIFGDNGRIVEQRMHGATISLSQSDYETALSYGLQLTFDMPVKLPGAFQVRVAARDRASSRIGSAGQFVAVPNLANKKFATSGVVLGVGIDGVKHELYNAGARRFTPNSDVYFAFMVYNAANETGALRNLVMQTKLFRDGKSVYSGPEEQVKVATNPGDLSRGVASGVVRLPADIEPGNYYLQVTIKEIGVKDKVAAMVQWVDFEVQK
ncbi:MAG TPA: VWA domain-containing protein [Pyrinomonadaceae bacterium]|jgi:VWFA-related protein